ncbi:hypothetical protein A2U01_0111780, partial [Trifolium medium]|nr:hypothetical protein [Trifolium medium]
VVDCVVSLRYSVTSGCSSSDVCDADLVEGVMDDGNLVREDFVVIDSPSVSKKWRIV